jgi:hypothetical protein
MDTQAIQCSPGTNPPSVITPVRLDAVPFACWRRLLESHMTRRKHWYAFSCIADASE